MAGRTRSSGHRDGFFVAFRSPDRPLAAFSGRESHGKSRKVTESQMAVSGCAIFVAGKFSERLSAGPSSPTRSPCRSTQTHKRPETISRFWEAPEAVRLHLSGRDRHWRVWTFATKGQTIHVHRGDEMPQCGTPDARDHLSSGQKSLRKGPHIFTPTARRASWRKA